MRLVRKLRCYPTHPWTHIHRVLTNENCWRNPIRKSNKRNPVRESNKRNQIRESNERNPISKVPPCGGVYQSRKRYQKRTFWYQNPSGFFKGPQIQNMVIIEIQQDSPIREIQIKESNKRNPINEEIDSICTAYVKVV